MHRKLELVTRVIAIRQDIVAPSKCGHCNADLGEPLSVRMECFTESDVEGHFLDGRRFEHEDETLPIEYGSFLPYRYARASCGSVIAESPGDRLRDGNSAAELLRELRGRFAGDIELLARIDRALEASA